MRDPLLLTFNAGSSTIKIGLFSVGSGQALRIGQGLIDLRQQPLRLQFAVGDKAIDFLLKAEITEDLHSVLDETLGWLTAHFSLKDLVSVGHRVVHGGDRFAGPVAITDETLETIASLIPLAPLHQPQNVRIIRAIRHVRPDLAQSASFDTSFHVTQSDLVRRFALPRRFFDSGIKRYGFHGLSYQFITQALAHQFPTLAAGKVVVAHLGSGASLCALDAGRSKDTSMGFSTLDGLPMATRCGALDAGVVLDMLGPQQLSLREVEDILYKQSGLLGVSGISGDSRELLASPLPAARQALDLFSFRIAGEVARLATTLGGLDGVVFTAGIGEHQAAVRAAVCAHLAWLGVALDPQANAANARVISGATSPIAVLIVPTDEEQVIANDAVEILHVQTPLA